MNHYSTYYQSSLLRPASHPGKFYHSAEIIIGALLLLSPLFWIFIAELIK